MAGRYSLPIPFGWYGIAFSADLALGQVKAVSYFGRDMVLFRTESGAAKVLDAFCPHLGAHLGHGGKIVGESIACPFHGWEFNGGGQCTKVPYAKNMPPKVAGGKEAIYAYPVIERNQAIFVWYHPDRIAPTFEIETLPEFNAPDWIVAQRNHWTINTTLQETAENPVDAAHFIYVHHALEMPAGESVFTGVQRSSKYEAKVPNISAEGRFDPASGSQSLFLHAVQQGPGFTFQRFKGALNIVLMGLATPITGDQMRLDFAFAEPKVMTDGERMLADFTKMEISRQAENDIPIWEHKQYLEAPTLCDGDGPINQYRKWFKQFYAPPAAKPGSRSATG
jgi:nitrite reductase/ring-hydroxylating ferredoxin subunit